MPSPDGTVHASCVIVGEAGILIRGASGSGKSTLARELLDSAEASGLFARLVCDDRVALSHKHGRIIARTVAPIAGRLEIRGFGIVDRAWEPAAVVRLVVDCGVAPRRMPDAVGLQTDVCGVTLPRVAVESGRDSAGLVLTRLRALRDTGVTGC
ncbi:MAG TPA: HPr kinase/phosphatase C-terminal domain-containing protein [Enterovirga sp.]|jgi:GTPase SAR1 family protein|nr:HPr kinase/phosphatase C-terminal domain-containing protein [Enterovirga sp.]